MDAEFADLSDGSVLIVGDGDFSFSVAFVKRYGLSFTTSTLETEDAMRPKYPDFEANVRLLEASGVCVRTGVDATRLTDHFADTTFSRIVFNFPHVGGKSNIKKNRQLLDNFFQSAVRCLAPAGRVVVTLCRGQGGTGADRPQRRWADSWQVTAKAANSGLVLAAVSPFEGVELFNDYLSTGFRSQNKRFHTDSALTHTFIRSRPLPAPVSAAVDMKREPFGESTPLQDFCSVICRLWNLALDSIDYFNCREQHGRPVEAAAHSQPGELPVYTALAQFRLTESIGPGNCRELYINDSFKLTVDNGDICLTSHEQQRAIVGHLNAHNLLLDLLHLFACVMGVCDVRYLLGDSCSLMVSTDTETGLSKEDHVAVSLGPVASLYPPSYSFDISFWLPSDGLYSSDGFVRLAVRVAGESLVIKEIKLIDVYSGKQRFDGAGDCDGVSHCYTVVYQSLTHALSFHQAYGFYQTMRNWCPSVLNVILR